MADTGVKAPTAAATEAVSPWLDNDWTTPGNIYGAGDASVTAATYDAGDQTYVLKAQGFDFSAIPDGSTINGVQVVINARYAVVVVSLDLAQLLDATGALQGNNKYSTPQALTTSAANYTVGGAADTWGATLTAAIVKNSNFGVGIGCIAGGSGNSNNDVFIDSVTMQVWYTAASLNYTYEGTLSAAGTWTSTRAATKVVVGNLSATATLAATRSVTKKIAWSQAHSSTWESGLATKKVLLTHGGDLSTEATFASIRTINKVAEGDLSAVATFASTRTVNIAREGSISAVGTWAGAWEYVPAGEPLDYTFEGTLAAESSWGSIRTIKKVVVGGMSAEATLAATRTVRKAVEGGLSAVATLAATRTVAKTVPGAISAVATLAATRTTKIVRPGTLTAEATIASPWGFDAAGLLDYTHTGALSASATMASARAIIKKIAWSQTQQASWTSPHTKTPLGVVTITGGLSAEASFESPWDADLNLFTHIGAISAEATLSHARSVFKKISTVIVYTNTFQSEYSKTHPEVRLSYTHTGALSAEAKWESREYKWPFVVIGNLLAGATWLSYAAWGPGIYAMPGYAGMYADLGFAGMSGQGELQYTHTGDLSSWAYWNAQYSYEHDLPTTLNYTKTGSISASATWGSGRSAWKTYQGALSATATLISRREIIKSVAGGLSAEATYAGAYAWYHLLTSHDGALSVNATWASGARYFNFHVPLSYTHEGSFLASATLAHGRSFIKNTHGSLSATATWGSSRSFGYGDGTKYQFVPRPATPWALADKPASTASDGVYTEPPADGGYTEPPADGVLTATDEWEPSFVMDPTTWTIVPKGEIP